MLKIIKGFVKDLFFAGILLVGFGVIAYQFNNNYADAVLYIGTFVSIITIIVYLVIIIIEIINLKKDNK